MNVLANAPLPLQITRTAGLHVHVGQDEYLGRQLPDDESESEPSESVLAQQRVALESLWELALIHWLYEGELWICVLIYRHC